MATARNITLRQGLEKFYETNQGYLNHHRSRVSGEAQAFFASHDVAHVLFACGISLSGGGAVKTWAIFGTTLGFWPYLKGYREANAFALAKAFSFVDVQSTDRNGKE